MSAHPNVILMLTLSPHDLPRKTVISILKDNGDKTLDDPDILIGGGKYHVVLMEDTYQESWQISGTEGEVKIFDLVTYGYGEEIEWERLASRKQELEKWAIAACEIYKCNFKISVTANHW